MTLNTFQENTSPENISPENISPENKGTGRSLIRQHHRCNETEALNRLLPFATFDEEAQTRINPHALQLASRLREDVSSYSGIQSLLNEFDLSTQEGIVLMCLAEALLRIPDSITADRLIQDKLMVGDWSSHLGTQESLFVNASAWGLLLSGKIVGFNQDEQQESLGMLKKTLGRLGEPVIRAAMKQAMRVMGTRFVLGRNIEEATRKAQKEEGRGYCYSYDMLGEAARTMSDADSYFSAYQDAIVYLGKISNGRDLVQNAAISIKLSAIHPRYEFAQRDRVMVELLPRLKKLVMLAKEINIGITVDAEEADRLDLSLDIIECIYTDPDLAGWTGFGFAVQAYLKNALEIVEWAIDLSRRMAGSDKTPRKLMLRLVKGAYWDTEIKHSQVQGFKDYPVFTRKASTDASFLACAKRLLCNRDLVYPQFATHNAYSVAAILELSDGKGGFEFQRLHGMGEGLYDPLLADFLPLSVSSRIYAPVGEHEDLLPYLVRRLLENGANSSFVHNIVDANVPIQSLLVDPVVRINEWTEKSNPNIPLPVDIYSPQRLNSKGVDLTDISQTKAIEKNIEIWCKDNGLVTGQKGNQQEDEVQSLDDQRLAKERPVSTNPADRREITGEIAFTPLDQFESILSRSTIAFNQWSTTTAEKRALCLEHLADVLDAHRDDFIALCSKDAGKTIADGVSEVREAVDYCRYYAMQARKLVGQSETPEKSKDNQPDKDQPSMHFRSRVNEKRSVWGEEGELQARGTILCISPWNFPLAIFLGQLTAALAAGNAVIAKAADSTCLVAKRAVALMPQCGFPKDVIQLIVCPGKVVGEKLLPDARIAGVMFTGSTAVGAQISARLSERSGPRIPLIAETGGQNCMMVDSTALAEQVVDDVIASGFQSAGQRCSALRVLYLQEEVADKIIKMIVGAMQELHVGDPVRLCTDVGPVIDDKALQSLEKHSILMKDKGKLLYQCKLTEECQYGSFFPPSLYEIDNIGILEQEVFGPVVHVIRYKAEELEKTLNAINSTGFGLTFGVHSRIQSTANKAALAIKAGNIYVNRNTIGAVVGVQPFGGRGLSGTGPKAGGPFYVQRLVKQKTDEFRSAQNLNATGSYFESCTDRQSLVEGHVETSHSSNKITKATARKNKESEGTRTKVDALLVEMSRHYGGWSCTPVKDRAGKVQRFISALTSMTQDSNPPLLTRGQIERLKDQCHVLVRQAVEMQAEPVTLPGPTGELNQWYAEPRGLLACVSQAETSVAGTIKQVCAAILTGNTVVHATLGEPWRNNLWPLMVKAGLASAYRQLCITEDAELEYLVASPYIEGIAVSGSDELRKWLDELKNQPGVQTVHAGSTTDEKINAHEEETALIPLITETGGPTLMPRFVIEKVVSTDTTASGGNATLLTMTDE